MHRFREFGRTTHQLQRRQTRLVKGRAGVYLAAVLDFMITRTINCAQSYAEDRQSDTINVTDLGHAFANDELDQIPSRTSQALIVEEPSKEVHPATNHPSYYPLKNAVESFNVQNIEQLLAKGANVLQLDSNGHNLLHIALRTIPAYSQVDKFLSTVSLLVSRKDLVTMTTNQGQSPLWYGVANQLKEDAKLKVVELLIQAGSVVDQKVLIKALQSLCPKSVIELLASQEFACDSSLLSAFIEAGYKKQQAKEIGQFLLDKYPLSFDNQQLLLEEALVAQHPILDMLLAKTTAFIGTGELPPPLFLAIAQKDLFLAQKLVAHDSNTVNYRDSLGRTILHEACSLGEVQWVKLITEKFPFLVQDVDHEGRPPLFDATQAGIESKQIIDILISKGASYSVIGANVNFMHEFCLHQPFKTFPSIPEFSQMMSQQDVNGRTPLAYLVDNSNMFLNALNLIPENKRKETINIIDKFGRNVIFYCIDEDFLIMEELIRNGIDLTFQDIDGETVMHTAFLHCDDFEELEPLFIKNGAKLDTLNNQGRTPLWYKQVEKRSTLDTFFLLNILGISPDPYDLISEEAMSSGKLQLECWDDHPAVTPPESIYEKTWFYNRRGHQRTSGYYHYIPNQDEHSYDYEVGQYTTYCNVHESVLANIDHLTNDAIARFERGEINTQDSLGRTAFHDFMLNGECDQVADFLKHKADPSIRDKEGRTVFMDAIHGFGGDVSKLFDMIKDINERDNSGRSLLHEMVQFPDADPDILIIKGIDVNARDNEGRTAVHEMIFHAIGSESYRFLELLKFLIDNKVDLNIQDIYGKTALHYAIENHMQLNEALILELMNENTNFNLRDEEGFCVTHSLFRSMKPPKDYDRFPDLCSNILNTMIQYGANFYYLDGNGKSAFDYFLGGISDSVMNQAVIASTPHCAFLSKAPSMVSITIGAHTWPVHESIIKYRAPLFFEQLEIRGNKATLAEEKENVSQLIEFIYTDTCSKFTASLLDMAVRYKIPRLEAMCNFKLKNVNVNLLLQYPSTLQNDLKVVYLSHPEVRATEYWVELVGCEDTSIKVPKSCLFAADYFSSMLNSGMQESVESRIVLPEISLKTLTPLVSFLITGTVECDDGNQLMDLIFAANQLCMNDLKTICELQLLNQIDSENIQHIQKFAEKFGAQMLLNGCQKFLKQDKKVPKPLILPEEPAQSMVLSWEDDRDEQTDEIDTEPMPEHVTIHPQAMSRLIMEIVQDIKVMDEPTPAALWQIQKAAENYLAKLFYEAKTIAKSHKRKFVTVIDLREAEAKRIKNNRKLIAKNDISESDQE